MLMFSRNIDTKGRILRLVIGVLLLAYAWWQWSWIALALALFTFFESYMSWCVFYQLIGKNSCPVEKGSNAARPEDRDR
jgi:hypothetical protein